MEGNKAFVLDAEVSGGVAVEVFLGLFGQLT
jgi:hypothetical protein